MSEFPALQKGISLPRLTERLEALLQTCRYVTFNDVENRNIHFKIKDMDFKIGYYNLLKFWSSYRIHPNLIIETLEELPLTNKDEVVITAQVVDSFIEDYLRSKTEDTIPFLAQVDLIVRINGTIINRHFEVPLGGAANATSELFSNRIDDLFLRNEYIAIQ